MMPLWFDNFTPYAAYAFFAMAWAVRFFSTLSYGRIARLVRRQIDTADSEPLHAAVPVSVVIAAHNQAASLERNLKAYLEQDYGSYEVIVVNDSSTDATEDVLQQLELVYPHLRHTFVPNGARHVSHERLALTVGIKAASHEWVLLSQPDSRPASNRWLSSMACHFSPETNMVLGYANYEPQGNLFVRKAAFFELYQQMHYLPWSIRHKSPNCNPANLAYRKSFFLSHKGFAEDADLASGAVELLVNRHSAPGLTSVCVLPDGKVFSAPPVSGKQWRVQRMFRMETRRHLAGCGLYHVVSALRQFSAPVCLLATMCAIAWGFWQQQWVAVSVVMAFALLLRVCITFLFNRSARALGERPYPFLFFWYELRMPVWHATSWLSHRLSPRAIFRRKAL